MPRTRYYQEAPCTTKKEFKELLIRVGKKMYVKEGKNDTFFNIPLVYFLSHRTIDFFMEKTCYQSTWCKEKKCFEEEVSTLGVKKGTQKTCFLSLGLEFIVLPALPNNVLLVIAWRATIFVHFRVFERSLSNHFALAEKVYIPDSLYHACPLHLLNFGSIGQNYVTHNITLKHQDCRLINCSIRIYKCYHQFIITSNMNKVTTL